MQRTQVQSLAWEDPTWPGITKPTYHNSWNLRSRACVPQQEKTAWWEPRAPQLESSPCLLQLKKARTQQRKLGIANDKHIKIRKIKKKSSVFYLFIPSSLRPLAITDSFFVSIVLTFPEHNVVEIIQPFQVSFFSLMCIEISSLSFYGLRACVFLEPNNNLAIVDKDAFSLCVQVFLWT